MNGDPHDEQDEELTPAGARPSISEVAAWLRRAAEQRDPAHDPSPAQAPPTAEEPLSARSSAGDQGPASQPSDRESADQTPPDHGLEDHTPTDHTPGDQARAPVEQPAEVSSTDETWLIERAGGQVPPSDEAVGLDVPPIREPGTDAPEDAVPSDDGAGGRADEPSPVIRGAVATPTGPLSFGDLAEGKEPAPEGTTRSGAVRPVPEHFPGVADADAAAGASADPLPASTSEDEDDLLPRTPPVKSPSAGAMAGAEDSLPEWPLVRATIQNDLGWAPARDDAASPTAKPIAKVGPARSDPPGVEAAEPSVGRRPAGASSVVSLFDLDLAELAARARASASASAKEPLAPTAEATGHESAVTTTGDTGDIAGLSAPPGESIPPVAVEPEGLDPESDEESDDTDPGKPAAKATAGLRRRVRPGRYPRGQLKERIGILRRVRAMLGVVVVTIILGVVAGGAIGVFLLLVAFAVRSAITSK